MKRCRLGGHADTGGRMTGGVGGEGEEDNLSGGGAEVGTEGGVTIMSSDSQPIVRFRKCDSPSLLWVVKEDRKNENERYP
jgi:hypothetical protein